MNTFCTRRSYLRSKLSSRLQKLLLSKKKPSHTKRNPLDNPYNHRLQFQKETARSCALHSRITIRVCMYNNTRRTHIICGASKSTARALTYTISCIYACAFRFIVSPGIPICTPCIIYSRLAVTSLPWTCPCAATAALSSSPRATYTQQLTYVYTAVIIGARVYDNAGTALRCVHTWWRRVYDGVDDSRE